MNIRYILTEKWDNSAIFRIVAMLFLFVSNFVIFLVSAKLLASIPGWLGISFLILWIFVQAVFATWLVTARREDNGQ